MSFTSSHTASRSDAAQAIRWIFSGAALAAVTYAVDLLFVPGGVITSTKMAYTVCAVDVVPLLFSAALLCAGVQGVYGALRGRTQR